MRRHHRRTPRSQRIRSRRFNSDHYRPQHNDSSSIDSDDGKDGRIYYYIYVPAQYNDGKPIMNGPYETYQQATDVAFEKLSDKQWTIEESKYRSMQNAMAHKRHKIFTEEGHDLIDSIKPMRHKIK